MAVRTTPTSTSKGQSKAQPSTPSKQPAPMQSKGTKSQKSGRK